MTTQVDSNEFDIANKIRTWFLWAKFPTAFGPELARSRELTTQVHAGWLKRLPFLEDTNLESEFYVALSLELTSQLFAPLEVIIDLHHLADK
eukprot:CAMPEP_0114266048 /NCGR_PEP_ID=MMETSP0058-20121206/24353_1 /TAXON_ID=36894 /ORGANISM="Pyramimonas parkeae, CCMP726" /LENGTH=91 /DNA_ID=CAMNT_0001383405 /DNA_START=177 /DNA_END=450 /DNA_ORIENTATION=+